MPGRYKRKRGNAGVKALKKVKQIKRDLQPETKAYDIHTQFATDTTGDVADLNPQVRGTAHNQVVGDQIKVTSLLIRGVIEWSATGTGPKAVVRIGIVKKLADDESDPTVATSTQVPTDILTYQATNDYKPLVANYWHSRKRYKHIWSELLVGNPDSVDSLTFKRFFRLNNKMFFGTTTTNVRKGSYFLYAITDEATNPPTVTFSSRMKYTDS